jgi:hypothetical protein
MGELSSEWAYHYTINHFAYPRVYKTGTVLNHVHRTQKAVLIRFRKCRLNGRNRGQNLVEDQKRISSVSSYWVKKNVV